MLISIDIGSTWTKGALFTVREGKLVVENRETTATTTDDLSIGFREILGRLRLTAYGDTPVLCSSSAHGGLKITAIGIVPDLTLESARLAALSAGGKLTKAFSYRLNSSDIKEIEASLPDIVLLTGGTDGGNRSYILHNAELLAKSNLDCTILYAGNRDLQDEVKNILIRKKLLIAANVLPDLNNPSPQEARDVIRETFMSTIIQGKGLQSIVKLTGSAPVPTPAAVFDYVTLLDREKAFEGDFSFIDMGGATTDYYSAVSFVSGEKVIRKGIREPRIKRSVEGDLGMRVSALSALESDRMTLEAEVESRGLNPDDFLVYLNKVSTMTEYIPVDAEEKRFDALLAGFCTANATTRHGGTRREVYTTSGSAFIERGRNLKNIKTIIGTGGYLAALDDDPFRHYPVPAVTIEGEEILSPAEYRYYRDERYLIPLLANAARLYPKEAAASLKPNLAEIKD
ncbi:methylaspartate mutase accessory protein GlmL [Spirochaeta isovalerica]|uniref:Uncharacterized protein (TIGR01319 family) n=1 Tax=Spirochaeta isovalerica TaxID=150 RepID=A0A841R9X4_9SPIO|nr:methylaspartate mutase accessory protein GlmL [Spirochaeta isovalerica]MBB6479810.1 uncharacterized protein (TIGR01319 family) [Spirochaeta isovalerica]